MSEASQSSSNSPADGSPVRAIRGRPTIRDVAARAGVSIKTVSRVVNGAPTVAPELAARTRAAIQDLGYRPDHVASSLRRGDGRSRTIAVVLEDLANPFSAGVHRAVVDTARARGVLVLAASSDENPDDVRDAVAAFTARRVDGIILMPAGSEQPWLQAELEAGTSMVMVDRPIDGVDAVLSDNRDGAARATTHLLRRGHRRIALLSDLRAIYTARERLAGYRQAMASAGLGEDDHLIRVDLHDSELARRTAIELLTGPNPPTALFTAQNLVTVGALQALRQLGLHHSVALVGFDDIMLGDLLEPGVTVIAQDPATIGRLAAEQLLARIDRDESPPHVQIIPTRLVPRGSGEIPGPEADQSIATASRPPENAA